MSDPTQSIAEAVTSHSDVVVERELSRKEGGIVGTLQIRSGSSDPVEVHVVDEFPAALPIDEVGFRPGAEPESGEISSQRAAITQPIDDDPVEIEYGIKLSEAVDGVQFDPPVVRDVKTAAHEGSPVPCTDGGEQSSVSADASTESDASSRSLSSMIRSFGRGRPETGETGQHPSIEPKVTDESATTAEASNNAIERAVEQVDEENENGGPELGVDARGGDAQVSDEQRREAEAGDAAERHVESAVTLDDDATSADALDSDGDGYGQSSGDAPEIPRSVDLRIDRLSARVEEFATYATALESLIDEHGTATGIIDRVEGELDSLDDRVESIRTEMEAVEDRHAGAVGDLHERTDELEGAIETVRGSLDAEIGDVRIDLDDEVARIDTELAMRDSRLDTARSDVATLDDRVGTVEDEVQGIRETVLEVQAEFAGVSDDVEAMREEINALRTEVSEFTEVRESLADVFEPPAGEDVSGD